MADSIFGFVGADYVMLIADSTAARSVLAYKHDEDKVRFDAAKQRMRQMLHVVAPVAAARPALHTYEPRTNMRCIFARPVVVASTHELGHRLSHALSTHSLLTYFEQIRVLDSHKMAAAAGPQADCSQFVEYIQKNVALYEFRTNLKLSTKAAVAYVRGELAYALRSNPYQVNLLIGGWDAADGPSLHFMDYIASATQTNFGAQGYAGYFILSTMDRHWRAGMTLAEGKELARKCIKELQTRFVMNQPTFVVKVADVAGVRVETL